MTKSELFAMFPANGRSETEQARGLFLAALRLRDALFPAGLLERLVVWQTRRRTAAALAALPESTLRDIGLARGDIDRIAAVNAATAIGRSAG